MRPLIPCILAIAGLLASSAAGSVESDLATIYATEPPKPALAHDGPIAKRLDVVIQNQARFLKSQLHAWEPDPRAMLVGNGGSGEIDIRSNAHIAFGLAVIARTHDDADARDKSIAVLRFLLSTHGAGELKCADGKQWHNQWQTAMWAYSAGKAAWLLWGDLNPQLRWLAARMICDEADRFIELKPPMQIERDTKAEENAWNSTVIALAFNMFPRHPHHEKWRETAIRWQISSFVTAADARSDETIDDKPLNQWLTGANLYDDYTLENHDRVHPDYMGTIRINLHQKLTYNWAGNEPPASLRFNARKIYANLKKLALPDGNFVYPSGQDWHIHRNADWLDVHTMMAVFFDDKQAARLMRISLETAEKMAGRNASGSIHLPDEVLVYTSHPIFLELYADVYLHLRQMGEGPAPIDESTLWKDLVGTHVFNNGKFAAVRTENSIATFSWGRQVMGMVLPLRRDLLLTPNDRGLIGNITLPGGKRDQPVVKNTQITVAGGHFAVAASVARAGGAIEQRFAFVALADGRVIYVDALAATGEAKTAAIHLGQLGVLNELNWPYHTGRRTLDFESGQRIFAAADAAGAEPVAMSSRWYSLDDLGIACLKTSGRQIYQAAPSRIRARQEQVFVLNAVEPDAVDSAQTALVFFPDADASETRERTGKCRMTQSKPRQFAITCDDGKTIAIDLEQLTVELK